MHLVIVSLQRKANRIIVTTHHVSTVKCQIFPISQANGAYLYSNWMEIKILESKNLGGFTLEVFLSIRVAEWSANLIGW